jgi:hypothetical protein
MSLIIQARVRITIPFPINAVSFSAARTIKRRSPLGGVARQLMQLTGAFDKTFAAADS